MKTVTIDNLADVTAQDVFDFITEHLRKQKEKSLKIINQNGDNICVYWNKESGTKCAAGCLIPEEKYDIKFEKISWLDLIAMKAIPHYHGYIINELQKIHDKEKVDDWEIKLKEFADANSLIYKKLWH